MRTKQRNNLAETARHERVAQNTDVYAVKARNYKGLRRGSPVFYPIWWYQAPRIIQTFLESADFSGKTVIPFATSGGSGMGKTVELLRSSCAPDTRWNEGKRLSSHASAQEVSAWTKSLSL